LLGSHKCNWGPAYWCANLPQASECQAVSHCIEAVWSKEKVPKDTDEVCDICKEMVGEARDTLLSNETQEELREVLEGSCDLIPIGIIAKECRVLIDQFAVELVETLASEMNPDTVCTVAGLCNSARIDRMIEKLEMQKVQKFGGDCNICREGAQEAKNQLSLLNQDQVEDKMLELCGYMGSFSDACRAAVLEDSYRIFLMLTTQFNDEICDLSGLCSQAFDKVPATVLKAGADIECEFCEKVVKHWIDVYASNSSLAEFKALMDGICEKLDKSNAEHCKHVVDEYYIPFFEFLRNEIDPHTVCAMVGLCGPGSFMQVGTDVPLSLLSRGNNQVAVPLVKLRPATPVKALTLSGSKCEMCDMVMVEVFSFLEDKSDQRMVKNVLDTICYRLPLPAKYERRCEDFVAKYTGDILDFIVNGFEPEQICVALSLCGNNLFTGNEFKSLPITLPLAKPAKPQPPSCVLCEYVISTIDKMLEDKANEKEIEEALETVCSYLPGSISKQCNAFVDAYTEIIIDMLTKDVSPEMVCTNLGLCPQDFAVTPELASKPQQDSETQPPGCVLCEYVIDTIDKMLTDKTNEDQIKQALEEVCSYLPSSLSKQCNTFVDTYTDIIIDMLTKDVSPEMVCTNLGLCKETFQTNKLVQKKILFSDPQQVKSPYCTLCEVVVQDLEKSLGNKKTQASIEQALDIVCTSLSAPVHKECEKMVAKYTEEIVDLFLQEYTAKEICAELGLCVDNQINTNDIFSIEFDAISDDKTYKDEVGCEMCEFAMTIIDERLKDPGTVDEVEREIQFVCSFLPDSVADECEQLVDKWGEKIIDAIVDDDLEPKKVCGNLIPGCEIKSFPLLGKCPWGPEYYCASPFHAKICGATKFCQTTGQLPSN